MEFRRATIEDIDSLVELRKQQLIDEGLSETENIDAQLHDYFYAHLINDTFISWLAVEDGQVVATSGLSFYQVPPSFQNPSGKVAYVTNMFTIKQFRRKGIASVLLDKILSEVPPLGITLIRLHASDDGGKLYPRFGFEFSEGYMEKYI